MNLRACVAQAPVLFDPPVQLVLGQVLGDQEVVAGTVQGPDDLVELEMGRLAVPVLAGLEQEHHERRDDGRAGVRDEVPVRIEPEIRPRGEPDDDGEHHHEGCDR
jgi:hypothetical protein